MAGDEGRPCGGATRPDRPHFPGSRLGDYGGHVLRGPRDHKIGTLCLIDDKARGEYYIKDKGTVRISFLKGKKG